VRIDVKEALEAWLPALGLPAEPVPGVKDLEGRRIRVAKFNDEEVVQFFFPRRSITFQRALVRELGARLRKRGARIDSVALTPADFARWRSAQGADDTPEVRYRFASAPPEL
jgi:hypothetical protein